MKTTHAVWRGFAASAFWGLLLAGLSGSNARADSTFVYAVQISAQVQASPPKITLNWEPDPYGASSYTIYRKAKTGTAWGAPLAYLSGDSTSYFDAAVTAGTAYEYQIIKIGSLGYTGTGYIFTGINVPMTDQRGTVVLLVGSESTVGLDYELARLQTDLIGDGWQVLRHDVSTNDTPDNVRAWVLNDYWAAPDQVNTVFLFGHVPVLQSGYLDYDGHGARPMPADAFYGDVYYDWPTDPSNSPSYLPSDVPLMVGRVDFYNMVGNGAPSPWPSETELLRNYLNKDHSWRQKLVYVQRRALLGNRRGDEDGQATAASGYRSFEPMVGPGNTIEANIQDNAPVPQRWMPMLAAGSYLWAFGNGGGQDYSIGYLGTSGLYNEVWSSDIVGQNAQVVFVMLFGSHLGNWDHTDNIMRSVLATPTFGLACCMSGEPHWFLHHMGLGETIGYSTRLTLNNNTLYQTQENDFTRAVYIAVMGDPTLRLESVAPAANLNATPVSGHVALSWSASGEPNLAGYYVYRANSPAGPFSRLTNELLAENSYVDSNPPPGTYTYMVRAVALVINPSGSYFDPSQGIFTTVTTTGGAPSITLQTTLVPGGLQLTWNSQAGITYHVECANSLNPVAWSPLSSPITATGPTTSWTDPTVRFQAYRFYRISSP
jgi:hypothetical protein